MLDTPPFTGSVAPDVPGLVVIPSLPLGASDCEHVRGALIGQPVNTVSSLAYLVGGLWVLRRARDVPQDQRPYAVAAAFALVALGAGSVAFHGPGSGLGVPSVSAASRWLHDLSLAGVVLLVAMTDASALLGLPVRRVLGVYGAALAGLGGLFAVLPDSSVAATAATAVGAAGGALAARRRQFGGGGGGGGGRAYGLGLAALASGALVGGLSRTGGPWCRPESLLQGHALWHLLTALAAACWVAAVLPANRART